MAATRRVSWPVAHQAFAAHVDPLLARPVRRVAVLGIDEHRRGRARWREDPETGKNVLVTDKWHTCFYDLSGTQGLLGQVEGRTSADAAYWLALAPAGQDDPARHQCLRTVFTKLHMSLGGKPFCA